MPTPRRSSAVSNPAEVSLARWPLERGKELKGRCIFELGDVIAARCDVIGSTILINAQRAACTVLVSGCNGAMAQGGLKKKSEKFSITSKPKSKVSKQKKPLGPRKGGKVLAWWY